ncbi:MAG: alpha/beta hydrolase family protein [Aristaeellaceae bacterium]
MHTESIRIAHHGRAVDCTCWLPEGSAPVPAVILSHGYNGTADSLARHGQHLARHGIAALCLTLCGGSTRDTSGFPTTAMTLFTERDDILAVLDRVRADPRISRVFLFGESMGGMASVLASAEAPEKIAGLGLLYPALCIADNWREQFPEVSDIPETVDFWGMLLGRVYFTSMRGLDIFSVLPAYRGPVLLLHGTLDDIVPIAYSEKAAALYQNAALHVFPEEKHGFSDAGTQQVCELLTQFVLGNS